MASPITATNWEMADDGVTIVDASLNIIGGLALEDRNLISCNVDDGISMIGMLASDNFIQGNFIGTDVNGTAPLGNFGDGVVINNAPNNAIGGAAIGAANVISSNAGDGVFINGIDATGNLVLGNFIGTNVNGTAALGNGLDGVAIQDAPGNSIGGPNPGEGNLISANGEDGVFISGADAEGNTVQGNKIGTDVTGTAALGNGIDGVGIQSAPGNTIGGPNPGEGNLISANGEDGVFITREEARGNTVQGNKIGTDVTGTAPLGNGIDGVGIDDAPDNTIGDTVGGPNPDAGNLISANGEDGVFIRGITATGNLIRGNRIGTDQAGNVPLANDDDGVEINNASDNLVTANVISGNLGNGVQLIADAAFNDINRNFIGTNDSQTACDGLGNGGDGVAIVEASFNFIGGDQVANGNVISCNVQDGVSISGQAAVSNDVTGNSIGTLLLGQAGGNGAHGIHILDGAAANEIGGAPAFPLDANTIAFNGGTGVFVDSGTGNRIRVNSIHSNGQLGIDLNAVPGPPDGVTLNDIQPDPDADTGANNLQNFPDFDFAMSSEGLRVFGTLSSLPVYGLRTAVLREHRS